MENSEQEKPRTERGDEALDKVFDEHVYPGIPDDFWLHHSDPFVVEATALGFVAARSVTFGNRTLKINSLAEVDATTTTQTSDKESVLKQHTASNKSLICVFIEEPVRNFRLRHFSCSLVCFQICYFYLIFASHTSTNHLRELSVFTR